MKNIENLNLELQEVTKELKILCTEDGELFRKGCLGKNSKRINILGKRKWNLQINLNQLKQRK